MKGGLSIHRYHTSIPVLLQCAIHNVHIVAIMIVSCVNTCESYWEWVVSGTGSSVSTFNLNSLLTLCEREGLFPRNACSKRKQHT